MNKCVFCQTNPVIKLIDFGMQPISNRFLSHPTENEYSHPLILGYCQQCYLVQLINPAPSHEIMPQVDWIHYNEPEGHLDHVAEIISQLPGISQNSNICGVSGKEGSLLDRLKMKGLNKCWLLDLQKDLEVANHRAGLETIQEHLDIEKARNIAEKRQPANVLIARHILEHAHHPHRFMQALRNMVDNEGYIIFEVPDCTKIFETYEYSTIWEEHTLYFTPYSFLNCLKNAGFSLQYFGIYPYTLENCLVAIVKLNTQQMDNKPSINVNTPEHEENRICRFASSFIQIKERYHSILAKYHTDGAISILGAGHLACHFINLMGLKDLIDFVADDNLNKIGLYMPGSQLPIQPTSDLFQSNIKTCLMSLNQESEDKVIHKLNRFVDQGGRFASIFSTSKYAMN